MRKALFFMSLAVASVAAGGEYRLSAAREFTVPLGAPRAVELADYDSDGALDAFVVCGASNYYACYKGDGTGGFGAELASGSLYLNPSDLVVGDFDGQYGLDIAAINDGCG